MAVEIQKIVKKNLVDEVCKQLREMIHSGALAEGDKLSGENQLAERFAVSRVVIREALQRLRSERLVVTRQGMGSFVTNPQNYEATDSHIDLTEKAYADLLEFRRSVEYTAVELAAARATKEDFRRLFDSLSHMEQSAGDIERFSTADFEFHYAIVRCAHNEMLERAYFSCRDRIISIFIQMNTVPGSHGFGVGMHEEIAAQLSAGKTKAVLKLFDQQASYNWARLSSFFHGENTEPAR